MVHLGLEVRKTKMPSALLEEPPRYLLVTCPGSSLLSIKIQAHPPVAGKPGELFSQVPFAMIPFLFKSTSVSCWLLPGAGMLSAISG